MHYASGDSHFVEASSVAQSIESFNDQLRDSGHLDSSYDYEQKETDYINDVQAGNYHSDYRRIQIANAIERINAKISHMKPSIDGRVSAPGEESVGLSMDTAPSGSEGYREYYIKEMARRVNRGGSDYEPEQADGTGGYSSTDALSDAIRPAHERSVKRRHRKPLDHRRFGDL